MTQIETLTSFSNNVKYLLAYLSIMLNKVLYNFSKQLVVFKVEICYESITVAMT